MKKILFIILMITNTFIFSNEVEDILDEFADSILIPNLYGNFTITLISKNGAKREIQAEAYQKLIDNTQMNRLFKFKYPPSVRDTGLLIHSFYNEDNENQMWIYLPIVKKIKRIALSSSGGGYFMGSDFSYADLISKDSSDFTQELIGEKTIENIECNMIKEYGETPEQIESLGYSSIINYYGKDDSFLYGRDYYEISGDLLKTYRVKETKKFSKYIYPTQIEMSNVQTDHKSIITVTDINTEDIPESYFTTRNLKK